MGEESIKGYEFPLQEQAPGIGEWTAAGQHNVWTGRFTTADPPLSVLKMLDRGIERLAEGDHNMHVIPAGTPHHINHLFGYWLICDADRVWIRGVQGDDVFYVILEGGLTGTHRHDEILWYCPKCGQELVRHRIESGPAQRAAFWTAQLEHVRAFNRDAARRTCGKCGFVHPTAYGFHPAEDTAEESDARSAW